MIWLPAWLYERMPLAYLLCAALCIALFGVHPVAVGIAALFIVRAGVVLWARYLARRGRVPLVPREEDLALPSKSSVKRAARFRASVKETAALHRRAPPPDVADFSDTWWIWDEDGSEAGAGADVGAAAAAASGSR